MTPAFVRSEIAETGANVRLPIQNLVEARSNELGISRSEIVRRCGYKNMPKGIRRIEELFAGDLHSASAKAILAALPTALYLDKEIINFAVGESVDLIEAEKRGIAAQHDVDWRASFKPNAWLVGTESRPSSIVLYAITGGANRWLAIPLDLSRPPITFAQQAVKFARRYPLVPFFGATTGFVINYRWDSAVRFDVDGNPVEVLAGSYLPGRGEVQIGGRKIASTEAALIFGSLR